VVSGCCMAMLRHTKRQLYENIWHKKRLSSFFSRSCPLWLFLIS
jgi:hypothetical protein